MLQRELVFEFDDNNSFSLSSCNVTEQVSKDFHPQYTYQNTTSKQQTKSLDLHDYTEIEAKAKLEEFILNCKKIKQKKLLIITGKGIHSCSKGPILKKMVQEYLKQNSNISWKFAPPKKGGTGAFLLQLP